MDENEKLFLLICFVKFIRANFDGHGVGESAKTLLEKIGEDNEDAELRYLTDPPMSFLTEVEELSIRRSAAASVVFRSDSKNSKWLIREVSESAVKIATEPLIPPKPSE